MNAQIPVYGINRIVRRVLECRVELITSADGSFLRSLVLLAVYQTIFMSQASRNIGSRSRMCAAHNQPALPTIWSKRPQKEDKLPKMCLKSTSF